MSNALYRELNQRNKGNDFINQLNAFKQRMGNINPREEVMKCLQSGAINPQELNQMQAYANQFMR